jgi:hypothetical protein
MRFSTDTPPKDCFTESPAKQVAEKCVINPSGVKTPGQNADFMSWLKARSQNARIFPNLQGRRELAVRNGVTEAQPHKHPSLPKL